ncbi:FadR/GntR family transcriptional regulator [Staphylococcus coagulans]|uniref:FadR family transcriptional regulator n=1 Tax=Staphylococcus coagulans TaxID=74706 RepID=A0A9X0TLN8_9STAP|nr:FadR/GntR family transcriptional regulator [Staphylococcus coagulans]MBA8772557.1 FadR family transcriptional regulator [Staphylococcus coagulans]MBA8776228.1 FadR family transcriptional regulator [Staphylococcus coagulans]
MKITNQKKYEQIADVLIQQIEEGTLEVGQRLPSIQKLAEAYGVSNASMREALNALRMIGLVDIKHGYGTFVKQKQPQLFDFLSHTLTKARVRDILELRESVEVATAQYAALRHTDEDIQAMEAALEEMVNAIQCHQSGEEADLKFHLAIAKASHNALLYELLNNISDLIQQTMKGTRHIYIYSRQKTMEKLLEEHSVILEAIKKRQEKKAAKLMTLHLVEIRQTLVENYIVETN